jgi:two-component system nitrogen regulation response regulator GlnG
MSDKPISDVSTAGAGRPRGGPSTARVVPVLSLVSHAALRRAGERLVLAALAAGKEVALSRNSPELLRPGGALGTPLVDPYLSRKPIRLVPGPEGSIRLVVGEGGSVAVAGREVRDSVEIGAAEVAAGVPIELSGRVVLLLHLATAVERAADPLGMVGDSAGIGQVRRSIEQVADLKVPVLVRGETGTGKELVAGAIHGRSPRRDRPFVAVNLGAVPRELAAAELFGARKGAFTGATRDRDGLFRAADGGTLFLDEVGEASPDVQALLLRVLETGTYYPVGSQTLVKVDVRLVAATDADLEARIRDGQFKAPLLHRLSSYEIRLPPLRERREDIGPLFYHFARRELEVLGEAHRLEPGDPYAEPWLPAPLAVRLVCHGWPGNIRQLHNVTRQLVIGSRGEPCLRMDLPIVRELDAVAPASATAPASAPALAPGGPPRRRSAEVTASELLAALRASGWDVKAAAERLGVARSSVYDLIERCPNIRTAGDLAVEEIARCFHECGGDLDRMARRLEVSRRALRRRVNELGLA